MYQIRFRLGELTGTVLP